MCRLPMLSTALLLIFVGVLPEAIHCMPVTAGEQYHGGVMPVSQGGSGQCVDFPEHYCRTVMNNVNKVHFPNPRGHETVEEAMAEFNDFIPLLQSGCHDKLGTFLCFFYFPFCEESYQSLRIYPCKEVCEEVTHKDGKCTQFVNESAGGWNDQLQCDRPHFKPKSSLTCADGIAPCYPGSANCSTEAPTENSEESVTETSTEAPTDNNTDSEEPTETSEEECSSDMDTCPSSCDYRSNANQGTFKRNAYCYAARVTVKSHGKQGCRHAYTVEVKDQFDLQSPFNTTHSTKAPSMGDSAVILTNPWHCTQCPKLEVSKTYLISGPYSRAADGTIQWELGDSKSKALVSEWGSKYDRKLASFISDGNSNRVGKSNFFQECETDTKLVSAEQWIHH